MSENFSAFAMKEQPGEGRLWLKGVLVSVALAFTDIFS